MSNIAQLSARERILHMLDDNSFVEIGALVTKRSTDFNLQQKVTPADGVITGYGVINGKLVYVYSQDVNAMNGSIGEMHGKKIVHLYDLALKVGAPIIGLIDCAGLRLQEATDALNGFGEIYLKQTLASGVIPQISAILGTCGGGVAISNALSDFTFMSYKSAKLFVNSPNTLDSNYIEKCDTSSASFHSESGNVDFVEEDEILLLSKIRELITLFPSNNKDEVTYESSKDDLNRLVPTLKNVKADPKWIFSDISDNHYFLEIKENYGKDMVVGFIVLNGKPVGAIGNRSALLDYDNHIVETYDKTLTTAGCLKAEKFIKICDAFDIPILSFTNVRGYKATKEEEKTIGVAAAKLTYAFATATVPKVNVILEEAYGSAYVTMNSKHIGADLVFAYEDSKIGMMDAKAAVNIMYEEEIRQKDNIQEFIIEKIENYEAMQSSALSAANRGYVDAIIDPDTTRKQLIYAYEMLYTKRDIRPSKKHGTI